MKLLNPLTVWYARFFTRQIFYETAIERLCEQDKWEVPVQFPAAIPERKN
jgi:hypothetical protein